MATLVAGSGRAAWRGSRSRKTRDEARQKAAWEAEQSRRRLEIAVFGDDRKRGLVDTVDAMNGLLVKIADHVGVTP